MARYKEFTLQEIIKPNGSIIFDQDNIIDRLEFTKQKKDKAKAFLDDLITDMKAIENECKGNANADQLTRIRTKLEGIVSDLDAKYNQAVQVTDQKLREMIANNRATVADTAYLFERLSKLR